VQQVINAIPGNPHGKGWVERFFRKVKDDFLKLWMPQFYCGTDASPEALSHVVAEVRAGRMRLPTLQEFSDAFNEWLGRYVQRAHPEDASQTIAQVWAGLVPLPPDADVSELKRQAALLTVRRGMLVHGKRMYRHPDLLAFNGQKLLLEYDLLDNSVAVVRTEAGRWVCDAHYVNTIDAIDKSRLDEKRQLRAADAVKRLQQKMDEQQARAGHLIDVDAQAQGVIDHMPTLLIDHAQVAASNEEITLDLTESFNTTGDNDD